MNGIAIGKRHIFLAAVFVAVVVSFFGEWIDAARISFVSYSYFLMGLYLVRCYLFCILTIGFLGVCKKPVSFFVEFLVLMPVILGGLFVLCGFPFNVIMLYSRVVTVVQIVAVILIFGKALLLFYDKHSATVQGSPQQILDSAPPIPNSDLKTQISAPDFSKLSRREKDVALLILEGKKNDEIAEELFISAATVKSHIQHIFEKYEVRNRMEFANKVNGK